METIQETSAAVELRIAELRAKLRGAIDAGAFGEAAELRERIGYVEGRELVQALQADQAAAIAGKAARAAELATLQADVEARRQQAHGRMSELQARADYLATGRRVIANRDAAGVRELARVCGDLAAALEALAPLEAESNRIGQERGDLQREGFTA